jgi:hypothetical protein
MHALDLRAVRQIFFAYNLCIEQKWQTLLCSFFNTIHCFLLQSFCEKLLFNNAVTLHIEVSD